MSYVAVLIDTLSRDFVYTWYVTSTFIPGNLTSYMIQFRFYEYM